MSHTFVVTVWAALAVFVGVAPATADSAVPLCPPRTVQSSTKSAMAVFTGEVTDVQRQERTDGQRGALFLHTVTVTRVYQGKVTTQTVQVRTDLTPRQCSLGKLATGTTYMFFVIGDGNPWVAAGGSGTKPSDEQLVGQVERLLGEGRDPVPPAPEKAEFTPVDTSAPTSLSRAAAPGLALVLVGLLGLVVVRGMGRRPR